MASAVEKRIASIEDSVQKLDGRLVQLTQQVRETKLMLDGMAHASEDAAQQKAIADWLTGGDTGASSEYMVTLLSGRKPAGYAYPRDLADLGRCIRAIKALPFLRERMGDYWKDDAYWRAIVKHWNGFEALYDAGPSCEASLRALFKSCGF